MLLAWPATAPAHESTAGGERKLVLLLDRSPVRVVYGLSVAGAAAERARIAADRDANGEVDTFEANHALDARASALLEKLRICSGDSLDDVRCEKLERHDIERVDSSGWSRAEPAHLHFVWTLRLQVTTDQIGALRVEDDDASPEIAISSVEIEPPRGVRLLTAGSGSEPRGVASEFNWIEANRTPGPRLISATWNTPNKRRQLYAYGALVAGGLVTALFAAAKVWLRFRGRSA